MIEAEDLPLPYHVALDLVVSRLAGDGAWLIASPPNRVATLTGWVGPAAIGPASRALWLAVERAVPPPPRARLADAARVAIVRPGKLALRLRLASSMPPYLVREESFAVGGVASLLWAAVARLLPAVGRLDLADRAERGFRASLAPRRGAGPALVRAEIARLR
jgi:hypothetical protein